TNAPKSTTFVALDDGLEGLLHLSEMGDGALKEPYSYVQKGDRLTLRISHLEPERRRVGFTQRWGTEDEELVISATDTEDAPSASDVDTPSEDTVTEEPVEIEGEQADDTSEE
ncbi:MAG: S1 RNA-binding domain-containing protein, partial [Chloroflexota bacterium]